MSRRVVVAAFGNELRGDDGFGIAVLRRLEATAPPNDGVKWLEVGTAGLRLAQELLTPCDRLIVVDAMTRGGLPGTVYVLEVHDVPAAGDIDMHLAVPSRALAVAKALGALPPETFLVGCEPAEVDELTMELSVNVRAAIDVAAAQVGRLIGEKTMAHDLPDGPGADLARRDEVLEMLYWIEGEGFSGAATLEAIARFLTHTADDVRRTLAELVDRGDVTHTAATDEYRLTDIGRREAARRFAEEFAPMLNQGHGECNDPNCDCHSDPMGAAECHAARRPRH